MRKSATLGIAGIICLIALLATDRMLFAQGSLGGTIGKTDKSASGGRQATPQASSGRPMSPCRGAVGTWAFSNGVSVVIKTGGAATASDGPVGKWSCDGGMVTIDWPSWTDHYAISSAGNRMSGNSGYLSLNIPLTAEKR
jgi:hypothetical protein